MNDTSICVEATTPDDATAVEALLDLSFGLSRQTKTSYRLREGNAAIPGLSLVVRDAAIGLAGTISFWPLKIGAGGDDALLLGPLAVHPARQNLGIGLTLMREGLARAKRAGHRLVLLVGDAPYYARVGFQKVPEGRLILPGAVDAERFLYLELEGGAMAGVEGLVLPPYRFSESRDWRHGESRPERQPAAVPA